MKAIAAMLTDFARNKCGEDSRSYYLRDTNPDYTNVYRILDVESTGCWYGFVYTKNDSAYQLRESFTPKLTGAVAVWPIFDSTIELNLGPGEDHIMICRRTEGECQFSFSYFTKERQHSDAELIKMTASQDVYERLEDATWRFLNENYAAVFLFENNGSSTLKISFELDLQNLCIQGEKKGTNKFDLEVPPGEKAWKIFKPIKEGAGTSIGMSYSYQFE